MKIKLNKCSSMPDWYTIIRVEHDGKTWWSPTGPNSVRFMSSERLTPEADIEGSAAEMLAIAYAIKNREAVSFRRCAVHFEDDTDHDRYGVHLYSPRNSDDLWYSGATLYSTECDAVVTIEEANELADQIIKELGPIKEQEEVSNA